jgi:hypothetical protein
LKNVELVSQGENLELQRRSSAHRDPEVASSENKTDSIGGKAIRDWRQHQSLQSARGFRYGHLTEQREIRPIPHPFGSVGYQRCEAGPPAEPTLNLRQAATRAVDVGFALPYLTSILATDNFEATAPR